MRILYLPNSKCQQRQLEKPNNLIYPVLMAMEAQKYRNEGHQVIWNNYVGLKCDRTITQPEGLPFLSLPHPDRIWTDAKNPMYQKNGNFKYLPATYIQSASGCWWGKCSFCVEKGKTYQIREVEDVISEIEEIKSQGYKEVFDDSATFPNGKWLDKFCGYLKGIRFSCNIRMCDYDFRKMAMSGFRMVLFGSESANQKTLDIINKGVKVEDIKYIIKAAKAGLEPHIAVIFGFPNESDKDAAETLKLVWYLLKKGYAKTAQASFYLPDGNIGHRKYVRRIYEVARSPEFWFNQLRGIHDIHDLKYLWRKIKAGINDSFV